MNGKEYPSFYLLTKWANMKACLAGAGKGGTCYKDYKPFTVDELRRHVGIYIWNGLSPSPRVEYMFCSQEQDILHGSDFINTSFGLNAKRCHKHFKVR